MKEPNKMGKKWRNEFYGWNIADYLRVSGLVLNTNRTNLHEFIYLSRISEFANYF